MAEPIRSLDDVRPGDIFLGPIGGFIGLAVGAGELAVDGGLRIGPVDVRHAAIATPGHRLAQAMPSGAEVVRLDPAKHWTDRCMWVRLNEDYPGQAEDAAVVALAMVAAKVGYSFASYPALAAWRCGLATPKLEEWIGRRQPVIVGLPSGREALAGLPREAICSVFVDQAWSLSYKRIFTDDRPHQCVTPSQLGQRLFWDDSIVRVFPGHLPTRL